jgi:glucose dehydrogenase
MRKHIAFYAVLIATLLPLSTYGLVFVNAQGVNWSTDANYGLNWNYVDQSTLTSSTAQNLNLQWVFPVPAAPAPYQGDEGVAITPLVEQGFAYMLTNYHHLFAVNIQTGAIIWEKQLNVTVNNPYFFGPQFTGHYHNQNLIYSTHTLGRPLIWVITDNYTIYAFNADSGDLVLEFQAQVPNHGSDGNLGYYDSLTPTGFLDDQRGIFVIGTSVSEGTDAGRGFLLGYDVTTNPPTLKWMTPVIPPQDGSNPNWDIQQVQSMTGAWIFNGTGAVNLKTLPQSQLNATLYDDWGFARYSNGTNSFAGAGLAWGGPWAENSSTGLLFVGTTNESPDFNATFRPGPDLWGDSILAVDVTTGKLVWAFQTMPHDLQDYDCSWGVILANNEVIKGCKNGYVFGLNPDTGALNWFFNPPTIVRENSSVLNPLSSSDMTKPYSCYPLPSPCNQNPSGSGGIESDPAYNPQTGLVYVGTYNSPSSIGIENVAPTPGAELGGYGANTFGTEAYDNTTIWALNAANGQPVWNYNISNVGFRGGISTSGDLVFVPSIDGHLIILNAKTGAEIQKRLIGGPLEQQPAIATDTSGNVLVIQPVGSDNLGLFASVVPGDVVALSVSPSVTPGGTPPPSGVSLGLFYGVVVVAVILAVVAGVAVAMSRRKTSAVKPA